MALGGVSYTTPQWTNPSQGFTPWQTYTSSPFTPTAASMNLTFESWGRAAGGGTGSLPPFLLLDNVQILEETPPNPPNPPNPPTPTAGVPGPLPLMGVALAFSTSRRLRRRIKLTP